MTTPGRRLLGLRPVRSSVLIGVLAGVLGFAVVVQVRSTRGDEGLDAARQEDLVRILDDLTARGDRFRQEIDRLRETKQRLTTSADQETAALQEAARRAAVLGILAGTLPARGPGIELVVDDPERTVTAEVLLDAIQELRDAGTEAMQVNRVRIVASSYVVDVDGGIEVDGRRLTAPYRFIAVGEPRTLADAMEIPGGVVDSVESKAGARATVLQRRAVVVDALRALRTPRYARPSHTDGG